MMTSDIMEISIHAPARGATCGGIFDVPHSTFQSTLPRGERLYTKKQKHLKNQFQSTLPRGERLDSCKYLCKCLRISIHAPARGATDALLDLIELEPTISIHAPARGATFGSVGPRRPGSRFQSTLPRGERRPGAGNRVHDRNFNPRSREGSDEKTHSAFVVDDVISIHAPARGATVFCLFLVVIQRFQSTLPRGERPAEMAEIVWWLYFNPRSREGSDQPL